MFRGINEKIKAFVYRPRWYQWIFIVLLAGVSFLYAYHKVLPMRPQSFHQWRQCDCLSLTMNYYMQDQPFLDPELHCQEAEGGTSGHTISEFPVIYYVVAQLWKIFGHKEAVFRLLVMLIVFTGLFALFKMAESVFKDSVWAIGLVFLIFSSPVLVYYSNNFIANTPAFGLALIGLCFFWRFYRTGKNMFLFISVFIYMVAGLLKVTSLISFFAIGGIYFLEWTGLVKFKEEGKIFRKPGIQLLAFLIPVWVILLWYSFASNYNQAHSAGFFLIGILPVWNVDASMMERILDNIRNLWLDQYYNDATLIVSAILLLLLFVFNKKVPKLWLWLTVFVFFGVVLYITLFFEVFEHHDYYLINLYMVFVFIFIAAIHSLKTNYPGIFHSIITRLVFLVFVGFSISYAAENMKFRYWGWPNNHHVTYFKALEDINPYLRSLGIKREDKVISLPDGSFNVTLYLMDQKGYSGFGGPYSGKERMEHKISLGAKYLIINNPAIYEEDYIRDYIKNKIGSYKNVDIYRLPESERESVPK